MSPTLVQDFLPTVKILRHRGDEHFWKLLSGTSRNPAAEVPGISLPPVIFFVASAAAFVVFVVIVLNSDVCWLLCWLGHRRCWFFFIFCVGNLRLPFPQRREAPLRFASEPPLASDVSDCLYLARMPGKSVMVFWSDCMPTKNDLFASWISAIAIKYATNLNCEMFPKPASDLGLLCGSGIHVIQFAL